MATEKPASYWLTFVRRTYTPEEGQPLPIIAESDAVNTQNGVRDNHLDNSNDGNLNKKDTFDVRPTGNGSLSEPTQNGVSCSN